MVKEALTLISLGYQISIVHSTYSVALTALDEALIKGLNIRRYVASDVSHSGISSAIDKAIYKISRIAVQYLGIETYYALGYGAYRYLSLSKRLNADLYICHQELPTYLGTLLIKSGFKVAFDFEDWYSEDLLTKDQKQRPLGLLRKAESYALNNGILAYTTSKVLARELASVYNCKEPDVIYNVFPMMPISEKDESDTPLKLLWFSQTIGMGRGLEQFILMTNTIAVQVELHLLGNISADYKLLLHQIANFPVVFHGIVTPEDLHSRISDFDIGLALEMKSPKSRNFTITNKFFQYIQAGLPIIATNTLGQIEGFSEFEPGIVIDEDNMIESAEILKKWLIDPEQITKSKNNALAASKKYNWENESSKLHGIIRLALEK
ncbi:MAG: hypothetical protein EOO20_10690 [Chryseobacterium sp.]|nr:MAG: hypothetical protein EOO20_10690 [Chryseobacterium sp.]